MLFLSISNSASAALKPILAKAVLVLILVVAVARCNHQQPTQATTPTTTNSSSPYWRRPGCHRVGHTRTISIPGCVKFNISTNACRGYCLSYSIPASEDHETSPRGHFAADLQLVGETSAGDRLSPLAALTSNLKSPEDGERNLVGPPPPLPAEDDSGTASQQARQRLNQLILSHQQHATMPTTTSMGLMAAAHSDHQQQQQQQQSAGRRDVVSVSQCCNMMETEDVVVNLRCGANEIRRLVFKSAKTCECFFCKHF